jgi:hypothetical protein
MRGVLKFTRNPRDLPKSFNVEAALYQLIFEACLVGAFKQPGVE